MLIKMQGMRHILDFNNTFCFCCSQKQFRAAWSHFLCQCPVKVRFCKEITQIILQEVKLLEHSKVFQCDRDIILDLLVSTLGREVLRKYIAVTTHQIHISLLHHIPFYQDFH